MHNPYSPQKQNEVLNLFFPKSFEDMNLDVKDIQEQ
jgi:hypothetical protein